jgi:hypothetical protein
MTYLAITEVLSKAIADLRELKKRLLPGQWGEMEGCVQRLELCRRELEVNLSEAYTKDAKP